MTATWSKGTTYKTGHYHSLTDVTVEGRYIWTEADILCFQSKYFVEKSEKATWNLTNITAAPTVTLH